MKIIAFVFSQFPCYDETFILREMNQLKAAGLDFVITCTEDNKRHLLDLPALSNGRFRGEDGRDKIIVSDLPRFKKPLHHLRGGAEVESLRIPNVLIEAMAASLPVVCTLLPSIPELVKDGETGFIIPPKNPQAMAEMIVRLQGNEPLRRRVAEAGRRLVEEKFNAAQNAIRLMGMFLNVNR